MASKNSVTVARGTRAILRVFTSLKVVIPLILLTIGASVIGTLFPEPSIFQSLWYQGLLVLLGLSLLLITIEHIPSILVRKGRGALIGVITTHTGILVIFAGIIYGGSNEFRQTVRLIEGEMKVIPALPFVVQLEELVVEEFPAGTFSHLNLKAAPRKSQESKIAIYRNGEFAQRVTASPGNPAEIEDITLLPMVQDVGWYFELVASGPGMTAQVIPYPPWSPTPITIGLGNRVITAHRITDGTSQKVQILELKDGVPVALGAVGTDAPLQVDEYSISLGSFKRYTGIHLYSRPQMPILIVGCLVTFAGLLWHFAHRNRTQSWDIRKFADHA